MTQPPPFNRPSDAVAVDPAPLAAPVPPPPAVPAAPPEEEHPGRPAYGFNPAPLAPEFPPDSITPQWAWNGATGRGVRVAILDSGVDAGHPAVGSVQGYVTPSVTGAETTFDFAPHSDNCGHGTACAGIIRAVAPECEIYSVKVLDAGIWGTIPILLAGVRWALDNGMHVCNLSLSTGRLEHLNALHELADRAAFARIPLVCAAQNRPKPTYPALFSSVISVSSHEIPDPNLFYCNPQPPVEFSAFGVDVPVAWVNGGNMVMSGNSFAAPHIVGHIARLLSKHPHLSVYGIKTVLRALSGNSTGENAPPDPVVAGVAA